MRFIAILRRHNNPQQFLQHLKILLLHNGKFWLGAMFVFKAIRILKELFFQFYQQLKSIYKYLFKK